MLFPTSDSSNKTFAIGNVDQMLQFTHFLMRNICRVERSFQQSQIHLHNRQEKGTKKDAKTFVPMASISSPPGKEHKIATTEERAALLLFFLLKILAPWNYLK